MALFMIGYDLKKPGQDYTDLTDKIREISNGYWHHLDSTWLIVNHQLSATDIRDTLTQFLDANDEILVLTLNSCCPAAWRGFNQSASDWLKDNLK